MIERIEKRPTREIYHRHHHRQKTRPSQCSQQIPLTLQWQMQHLRIFPWTYSHTSTPSAYSEPRLYILSLAYPSRINSRNLPPFNFHKLPRSEAAYPRYLHPKPQPKRLLAQQSRLDGGYKSLQMSLMD